MTNLIEAGRDRVEAELGSAAPVTRLPALRSSDTLAGRIDHTILAANATQDAVDQVCREALEHGFASVCVNSRWVPRVADELLGSSVLTCSVVGFPLGAMAPAAKAEEARLAVKAGAQEIDMVIDIGALKDGDLATVEADIRGVVNAAGVPVKVIIETCLLTDEEKVLACLIAMRAGASYVKTSTGFSTAGATVEDIALMRAVVGDELGVKASGGVRTRETAEAMITAGADRIGASASVAITGGDASASSGY